MLLKRFDLPVIGTKCRGAAAPTTPCAPTTLGVVCAITVTFDAFVNIISAPRTPHYRLIHLWVVPKRNLIQPLVPDRALHHHQLAASLAFEHVPTPQTSTPDSWTRPARAHTPHRCTPLASTYPCPHTPDTPTACSKNTSSEWVLGTLQSPRVLPGARDCAPAARSAALR